jgi:hypothetical protein
MTLAIVRTGLVSYVENRPYPSTLETRDSSEDMKPAGGMGVNRRRQPVKVERGTQMTNLKVPRLGKTR